jgi:hypothetical protein
VLLSVSGKTADLFDRLDRDDVHIAEVIANDARKRYVGRRYGKGKRRRKPLPVTAWRQEWLPRGRPLASVASAKRWLKEQATRAAAYDVADALASEALDGAAFGSRQLVTPRRVAEPFRSLAELVAELTFTYPCWSVGGVAMFVLADVAPSTRWITFATRGGGTTPYAQRVTIKVDQSIKPSTLGAAWRYRGSRRATALQVEMAAFVRAHPDETWEQRRQHWNQDQPSHAYARNSRGTFTHNVREAYRRVYGHYP